jgi:hypothetical protein
MLRAYICGKRYTYQDRIINGKQGKRKPFIRFISYARFLFSGLPFECITFKMLTLPTLTIQSNYHIKVFHFRIAKEGFRFRLSLEWINLLKGFCLSFVFWCCVGMVGIYTACILTAEAI